VTLTAQKYKKDWDGMQKERKKAVRTTSFYAVVPSSPHSPTDAPPPSHPRHNRVGITFAGRQCLRHVARILLQ
jgi:hypothetical protein